MISCYSKISIRKCIRFFILVVEAEGGALQYPYHFNLRGRFISFVETTAEPIITKVKTFRMNTLTYWSSSNDWSLPVFVTL